MQILQAQLTARCRRKQEENDNHTNDDDDDDDEYRTLIRNLQRHEQQKLQYTAALHLEQIRFHELPDDDDDDDDTAMTKVLLQESIATLQAKLATLVTQINEALEEIQCAIADAPNDDGREILNDNEKEEEAGAR